MKICNKCKVEKSLCDFNGDKSKIDGKMTICKKCKTKYVKTY